MQPYLIRWEVAELANERFLIDANSLITPHLQFYPFDFAESFWSQIEAKIEDGSIVILDMVKAEILRGNDSLKEWMDHVTIGEYVDHRQTDIMVKYGEVLMHLQNNPYYKPSALTEWARDTVADAWLIATAAAKGYTIITFETPNNGLSTHNPSKKAKIPTVAMEYGVRTENLYYMMRSLGFKL